MQEFHSSNDALDEGSAQFGSEKISGAPLEELETLVMQSDHLVLDWQSWETVRDLSVGRMRNPDLDRETQIRWARLALAALSRKQNSGKFESASVLADEIHVRVYAVQHFGPLQGDPLRDPIQVCRAVFEEIRESRDDVDAITDEWTSLPRKEILRLRRIKNLLTLLRPIIDLIPSEAPQHHQLTEWLPLIPRLP
ncbi:hypothetical protein GCM10010293_34930 [Streptomyces griseoflavus]|uniref:hypothetical protein n=1 Tax=Streptomyces griseoflavus TaxID=35619 RepID=UPI00167CB54F|nr:hypothetical protein [Streptomyces griseoflavus]GGV32981.1 hypothetical protein GCM10010293_34930 [Streptomyces griseoflavus]